MFFLIRKGSQPGRNRGTVSEEASVVLRIVVFIYFD